ncbi:MAG: DUF4382 domain-containing protein [bacterium]|nr:DUF4382 domain-containing protein [bacterium]
MPSKSVVIAIFVIVVLGVALFFLPVNKNTASGQGRVVFGISDVAADIAGVSSIMMTVDKVEVQSDAQGWIAVSNASKQYDLLVLKQSGAVALLADINLPVGTYNQIRLTISKVLVTASGTVQEAKLPSGTLKIVGRIVVEEGKTASVVLDFKADKSLHITGNGKFVMAPVVNLQTKSGVDVEKDSDDKLKIEGGKDEDDVDVGMDENGDTREDFELDESTEIELDIDNVIRVRNQSKGDNQNEGEIKLTLSSQNNSGIAGTATIDNEDGKVKVTLKLAEVPTGVVGLLGISLGTAHPAHIHLGSCASLGAVKYPLTSTTGGKSETTLNVSLASLKSQLPLAVNVHKSPAEAGIYVACADLKL